MFNRAEILRSAWSSYRRDVKRGLGVRRDGPFSRTHFAYCLRMAWAIAKETAASAAAEPVLGPVATAMSAVNLLPAVKARLAEIEAELRAQDFSDAPTNWTHRHDLQAEREQLAA